MRKTTNPTLEDVARAADVSTATISRSINEPEKVAESTRERIQQVIQELGYTPNFGGRVLASNRSNTVGAIIPTMANAMFASGLQAFQEELSDAGVTLLVASSGYDPEHELQQIRSLITHGADGLLLIGASRPKKTIDFLTLREIPYVMSWCYTSDPDHLYAGFDNSKAAYQIALRVLETGHRRIAMIAGSSTGNDRARNRIQGVKRALKKYSLALVDLIETEYSLDNGGDAFEQLMSAPETPSAIICGNDVLAAGAIVRAHTKGIHVPQEVSVTGFDDISLAMAVTPALTTVRVPQIAMGRSAARLLLDYLSNQSRPTSIRFDTEIIVRDSLAPPA